MFLNSFFFSDFLDYILSKKKKKIQITFLYASGNTDENSSLSNACFETVAGKTI